MSTLYWLDPEDAAQGFPPVEQALSEPNGLLAAGGDLSPQRLLAAYRQGIFPWYEAGQPILWWSLDPRAVLFIHEFRMHRSLRKRLRTSDMTVTLDQAFADVMCLCAQTPRAGQRGTWITAEMIEAYNRLHRLGYAHSAEVWSADGELVGGLYGVALGRVFFGESMFSLRSDASKVGLTALACQLQRWGFRLIDCQQATRHLAFLGAREILRRDFVQFLAQDSQRPGVTGPWRLDQDLPLADWNPSVGQPGVKD